MRSDPLAHRIRWGLTVAALLAVAAGLYGQNVAKGPAAFDAVAIKPSAPPGGHQRRGSIDPTHIFLTGLTLKQLLQSAYHLQPYQVQGPEWINTQRFDVSAETTVPATPGQMMTMLRPVLSERFHLRTHTSSTTMPVYVLTVAAGGSRLTAFAGRSVRIARLVERMTTQTAGNGSAPVVKEQLQGPAPISALAARLEGQFDRPVVDETHLDGTYNINLTFTPMRALAAPGSSAAADAPSIFTALREQLGLQLSTGTAPVEVLTVEEGSRVPEGD